MNRVFRLSCTRLIIRLYPKNWVKETKRGHQLLLQAMLAWQTGRHRDLGSRELRETVKKLEEEKGSGAKQEEQAHAGSSGRKQEDDDRMEVEEGTVSRKLLEARKQDIINEDEELKKKHTTCWQKDLDKFEHNRFGLLPENETVQKLPLRAQGLEDKKALSKNNMDW